MKRPLALLLTIPLLLGLLAGCGTKPAPGQQASGVQTAGKPVQVLYAGSLVHLMEATVGPAFAKAEGYPFRGEGKGSGALAQLIKSGAKRADVFISADPAVNTVLMGNEGGNKVRWYATFAATEMVIGYSPKSKFAADLEAAAKATHPWYEVLALPGIRIGRTDPDLDPQGYRSWFMAKLAENHYHQDGLATKLLGDIHNKAQIFPEEECLARLEAGQLDAVILYKGQAISGKVPYISLPREINLSDPALNASYAAQQYSTAQGKTVKGGAITYTLTILSDSPNPDGATAFVTFLWSQEGQKLLQSEGLTPLRLSQFEGDQSAVPPRVNCVLSCK